MLFQQLDQKVMDVGAFVIGNAFALEVGHAANGRTLGHDHRLKPWPRHGGTGIDQRRTSGLGKDGRRFAHITKVDGADVQRLQLHRPGVEFHPAHGNAQWRQPLFQRAAIFENGQPAFLMAYPQHALAGASSSTAAGLCQQIARGQRQGRGRCACQPLTACGAWQ